MQTRDMDAFYTLLDEAFSLNPKWVPLTPTGKGMFFAAMSPHTLEAVRNALMAHLTDPQRGRFQPVPADLIAQIQANSGAADRPGPEEAWSIALGAEDESETLVWTEEMSTAYAICKPLVDAGDKVGARMAFKEAYARLVAEAIRAGVPPKWNVSLGHDPEKRTVAIQKATDRKQLPMAQAHALLPAPVRQDMVDRRGMAQVKAMLANLVPGNVRLQQERERQAEAQRQATADRKAELNRQAQGQS